MSGDAQRGHFERVCACGGPCDHDGSLAEALREQQRLHEADPDVFPPPPFPEATWDTGSPDEAGPGFVPMRRIVDDPETDR